MDIWSILGLLMMIFLWTPLVGLISMVVVNGLAMFWEYLDKRGQEYIKKRNNGFLEYAPASLETIVTYTIYFIFGFVVIIILSWSLSGDPLYPFRWK